MASAAAPAWPVRLALNGSSRAKQYTKIGLTYCLTLDMTMSEIPGDLKFQKSHEWVRVEDDGLMRVGISDHAQHQLGDLVYVELPEKGSTVQAGTGVAVIESVKAASDIYSPVSGEVVEVNDALDDKPEMINEDAFGDGWIFLIKADDKSELDELLDADAYAELIENEEH